MGKFLDKTGLTYYYSKINTIVQEVYAKIGEEKQNIIRQIIPSINTITGLAGFRFSYGTTAIASDSDLNNIVDPGRYWTSANLIAESLSNCPTTVTFVMTIEYMRSDIFLYTLRDVDGNIYTRRNHIYSNTNHFTSWEKVGFERNKIIQGYRDMSITIPALSIKERVEVPITGLTSAYTVVCTAQYNSIIPYIQQITNDKLILDLQNVNGWDIDYFRLHYICIL